ncbi:tyrosine recombinase XerC [Leifsonia sp. NPDC058248]|uniref:site-specific integrase n=1 Tax=Leifsonia sp. NPDC058248 TaxID=3346402 RepID=UPI0036DCBBC4
MKYWTAVVELPRRDGKRRRLPIRSKSKPEVMKQLREMQAQLAKSGDLETKSYTVEQWVHEWFTTIAANKNRPKTLDTYAGLIRREIIPAIGRIKLDKLTPGDVRKMNHAIVAAGKSSTTAKQVHRILAVALKYAEREGKVARNVATLIDAPVKAATNLKALTLDEGLEVLETATTDDLGSLWAAVLLMGGRLGELIGLQRDRVHVDDPADPDPEHDTLELAWQLQRYTWEHGCKPEKNPDGAERPSCGRKRGADCPRRKVTAPPNHEAVNITGGLWLSRPKTKAGFRVVPLVDPLRAIILGHMAATADQPNPHNLVWHKPNGQPIDPRDANHLWHAILDRAGVTQVRFHDGRHTAVDLLLLAGVPIDVVQQIIGHSSRAQTQEYKTRNSPQNVAAMKAYAKMLTDRQQKRSGQSELEAS